MMTETPHIAVCICTYQRRDLLRRLLTDLVKQDTAGLFSYSIVVADNDPAQSAQPVVAEFAARFSIPLTYCVEPERNIARVRNRALAHADGHFIAFIDDDEYPSPGWLHSLYNTCISSDADGAVGPVMPYFVTEPPNWLIRGKFFEKPTRRTGCMIGDGEMRTSNVLFRRSILDGLTTPFRVEFGTGNEDTDFFIRMKARGCTFVSCEGAVVYEQIPPARCTRRYLMRRALNRGNNAWKSREGGFGFLKSFIAVPVYILALPFMYISGEHRFMKYVIKVCDHTGLIMALCRIRPFREYK